MIFCVDINVIAVACDRAGDFTTWTQFGSVKSGASQVKALQHVVAEVLAGRGSFVTSEPFLSTVKTVLLRGGKDFRAFTPERAAQVTALLRSLSKWSGAFYTRNHVQDALPGAYQVCAPFFEKGNFPVDHEDVVVVATVMAAIPATASGLQAVLVSNDQGFFKDGQTHLVRVGIASINTDKWQTAKFFIPATGMAV